MFDRILDKISERTKEDLWKFRENLENHWVNISLILFDFFITCCLYLSFNHLRFV